MSGGGVDPDSLRYARYWEPVLAGPAHRALARITTTPATFLDLGAGTGSLTLAAAGRWPEALVVAVDAAAGMLSVARQRAADAGHDLDRFRWLPTDAADIPLPDATIDAVASSFMLQLPDDRPVVLAEVRRVLRPGGVFAFVTWLADELELPADEVFLDALDALGIADEAGEADESTVRESRPRDYRSPDQAAAELAATGFHDIQVARDQLRYSWTAATYLAYKEHFDERELFDSLDAAMRDRLRSELHRRLAPLPAADLELRGSVVSAVATRPATDAAA